MARGHIGERLRGMSWIEGVGEQHGVVHCAAQCHALRGQQVQRRFPIVRLFGDGGVFEQGAQF